MSGTLLIVEDETGLRESLQEHFATKRFRVLSAGTAQEGLRLARAHRIDVILLDHQLPDRTGLDILPALREADDEASVIMITAHPQIEIAVEAMKRGAADFLLKPFDLADLTRVVSTCAENRRLRREIEAARRGGAPVAMIGRSGALEKVRSLVRKVAPSDDTTVLVLGETGTGKELVVDALHDLSARADRPLVKVNCGAVPAELLEAELFGHERGAFTGAVSRRTGLIELAEGGTLFLDEIAELPLPLQPALLRTLDGAPFRRLGGVKEIRADVRFVVATNRDLSKEVRENRFREDLYHRLAVFSIEIPPLRERSEDVADLAAHFLAIRSLHLGRKVRLSASALRRLETYRWPGNVRELKNVIERTAILVDGEEIGDEDLPAEIMAQTGEEEEGAGEDSLDTVKRRHILAVLDACGGNRSEAARRLGISRSTLKVLLRTFRVGEPSSAKGPRR